MRDLSSKEWNRIVDAMWIMKENSDSKGKKKYGEDFRNYDELVKKHILVSLSPQGDMAHFVPAFPFFHRFWVLEAEMSLLAIDSKIEALPFWDPNREESVFTTQYMGSAIGNSKQGYIVTDGKFKYWPIKRDKSDRSHSYTNAFNFLRSPLSVNNAPYLTRNSGTMCGRTMTLTTKKDFKRCMELNERDIHDWMDCADNTLHGTPHVAIGGSWRRQAQEMRKGYEDSRLCLQWYSFLGSPSEANDDEYDRNRPLGNYIHPYSAGCFEIQTCKLSDQPDDCMPKITAKKKLCGPLWSNLPDEDWTKAKLVNAKHIHNVGDFSCSAASPNDPLFLFHHTNVDRNFEGWLVNIRSQKKMRYKDYLNYPRMGYASGTNLNENFFNHEFKDLIKTYFGGNGKRTFADIIDYCQKDKFDYIYDETYDADTSRKWHHDLARNGGSDAGSIYTSSAMADNDVTIFIIIAVVGMMFVRFVIGVIVIICEESRRRRLSQQQRQASIATTDLETQSQDSPYQFQMTHILSSSTDTNDDMNTNAMHQHQPQQQMEEFKEAHLPTQTSNRLPLALSLSH